MNVKRNIFFKLGCVGMITLIALGAKYGHTGALDEQGVAFFQKAQLYHLLCSIK